MHLCRSLSEIVSAATSATSKEVQEERSNTHTCDVTEVLRERSTCRPVQVMLKVVARPVAHTADFTQQSVDYVSRNPSRVAKNENLRSCLGLRTVKF